MLFGDGRGQMWEWDLSAASSASMPLENFDRAGSAITALQSVCSDLGLVSNDVWKPSALHLLSAPA